jgi:zinc protease
MIKKLQQVTAAQVQAVANKYFVEDSLTIAVLDPQPLDSKKPAPSLPGLRHAQ